MKEEEGPKIESSLKEKGDLLNHFRVLGGFLWIAFYVLGFWRTRNTGVIIVKMPDKNVNYWKDGFIEFSQFNH